MAGLVFDWLLKQGGLKLIEDRPTLKNQITLYDFIDSSDFYINNIDKTK